MFDLGASQKDLVSALIKKVDEASQNKKLVAQYRFGFFRLTFGDSRLDDGFVLHLWLNDLPTDDYPHTHIFDLESRILLGKLVDTTWELEENPEGDLKLIKPHCTENFCTDEEIGTRVNLKKVREQENNVGDTYQVKKGEFHTTQIVEYPTLTLMKKSNISKEEDPLHLVPVNQKKSTRSFDYYDHDQDSAWSEFNKALDLLKEQVQ